MKPLTLAIILYALCACKKNNPVVPPRPSPGTPHDTATHDTTTVPPAINDTAVEYSIAPKQTDPQINIALDSHFISVKKHSALKNILFVFLPGSYARPAQYTGIVKKAADLGYHAIGLMYPDDKPVNGFCASTNDTTCHTRARLEIVDGVDRSPNINVNTTNSIINRLQKLLAYLKQSHPDEHWEQYLNGDSVKWNMVIMSGHSQGGGNAAVMGRFYPLKKIIMFSMMDWLNNGKIPDWENMTANNGNYYDIYNTLDEDVPYAGAKRGWQHMGMTTASSPMVNSDSIAPPYQHAHVLLTAQEPARSDGPKYHNSTVMDAYVKKDANGKYVLDKQWEYLINE